MRVQLGQGIAVVAQSLLYWRPLAGCVEASGRLNVGTTDLEKLVEDSIEVEERHFCLNSWRSETFNTFKGQLNEQLMSLQERLQAKNGNMGLIAIARFQIVWKFDERDVFSW